MKLTSKESARSPGWFEVVLGAILSVLLGLILGAAFLIFRPVLKVAQIPKDAPSNAVYYIPGSRDYYKAAQITALRRAFLAGQSVVITEGELNVFLTDGAKPAEKKDSDVGPKPVDDRMIKPGELNARIHDGKVQFADTLTLSVYGMDAQVTVQTNGSFVKRGSGFVYEPEVFYVGGCSIQRFPFLRGWASQKLLFTRPVPDDIAAAWSKLADVTVEGTSLRLKMP